MKHYITYKYNGNEKVVCTTTLEDLIEYLEIIKEEDCLDLVGVETRMY